MASKEKIKQLLLAYFDIKIFQHLSEFLFEGFHSMVFLLV